METTKTPLKSKPKVGQIWGAKASGFGMYLLVVEAVSENGYVTADSTRNGESYRTHSMTPDMLCRWYRLLHEPDTQSNTPYSRPL